MSCGNVKNPPGFALCRVAKSKTRRVSRHVEWQSPKPAGFCAMSCGNVKNPPGFAPCRVTKSKSRRVLRHVVWQSPKSAKFSPRHVAKSKTCRVLRHVVWQSPKPAGFRAMSCGKVQNPPGFAPCRVREYETRQILYVPV